MKSFLISGNRDTYLGLKLAGIDGVYVKESDQVLVEFKKALLGGYGIILITENIYQSIKEEVIMAKTTVKVPLITVIPDRHGYDDKKERITNYIKDSIGL